MSSDKIKESVKAYQDAEKKHAEAKRAHQDAQSAFDKRVATAHKAGAPISDADQREAMRIVSGKRKEADAAGQTASSLRKKSDHIHNKEREAGNYVRGGPAARTLHQGGGSHPGRRGPNAS